MGGSKLALWAITGIALTLFVGLVGAVLAWADHASLATTVFVGAQAGGAFAGLWIAGSLAVHTFVKRRPESND